jgi:hypothetical protein
MVQRTLTQRMIGLLLLAAGALGVYLPWRSALANGNYSRVAAALLPALAVLGLGLAVFPYDANRQHTELNLDGSEVGPRLPLAWQYILLAAVLAGLANWYAIALAI